jgi:hypothetical protein
MIRTVITAEKNSLLLSLPDNYVGRQVEVIAFTIDEPVKQKRRLSAKDVFKSFSVNTQGFKFNRDEANSR